MSLRAGYQIINLRNREFSTTLNNMEYYKDIYFNLLNSHAKMIIVSGLNMDGVKYNDHETIFYEVEQPDDNPYFQCIDRRIWNTKDYKCITKYINIYSDDRVMCSQEEFTYEILPDGEMSLTSTNALQNKVITKNINRIDAVNERQNNTLDEHETRIRYNTDNINRNAVGTAIMPNVILSNDYGDYSTTGYVYKYSNGLYFIAVNIDNYDETNQFFEGPIKVMQILNFYDSKVSVIQRSICSSNTTTRPCKVSSPIEGVLMIEGNNNGYIAPPALDGEELIFILLSAEN